MRRFMILMTSLAFYGAAHAQTQLPNPNFEQWSLMPNGKDSASGWSSSNGVVIGMTVSLVKATPGYQGSAAAHVVTSPFGFVQYSTLGILVNGNATFSYGGGGGGANVAHESGGGTPINTKPSNLKGYFRYETLATADQGLAIILLSKYNTTLNKRDTVSIATHSFATTANYTPFQINLPDMMPGTTPDTITTIFYASNPATLQPYSAWSDLFLDSLRLTNPLPDAPVTAFNADVLNGTTNTLVSFTDNSTNTPTSWQWTITPATVAYQAGTTSTSANPKVKFTAAGDYTVKLRVANAGGADSLTKTNYIHITSGGTGIEDRKSDDVRAIYPNPASGKVHLTMEYRGADVTIVNVEGKTVASFPKVNHTIDISQLSSGLYLLRIRLGDKQAIEKLIVQNK